MPDSRRHRGAHPGDAERFGGDAVPRLRAATADFAWLLSRGYADKASLKLVGDRFRLDARQRMAVWRSACSDAALDRRLRHRVDLDAADRPAPETLRIDGHNVLTTVESLLGGGYVLVGRDGCLRDVAGVHGTWRRVVETMPGLELVGEVLARTGVRRCRWYLDAPVSNSGRLKGYIEAVAAERGWPWDVELVGSADPILAGSPDPVATSDGWILDQCARWANVLALAAARAPAGCKLVDLRSPAK